MYDLSLDKKEKKPLYLQLFDRLKEMIDRGAISPGARLPGGRELSRHLNVSRSTVDQAYILLEKIELVDIRARSGVYVKLVESSLNRHDPESGRGIRISDEIDLSSSLPSLDIFPRDGWESIVRGITRDGIDSLLGYGDVKGSMKLRNMLMTFLASRGMVTEPERLFIVSGVQQGLYLSMLALQHMGCKRIFSEELTYPGFIETAKLIDLPMMGIKMDEDGLNVRELSEYVSDGDAVYVMPSFQNPTGVSMSLERRKSLLELSKEKNIWIIEDDTYGELRDSGEPLPALKGERMSERVIYAGGFSQLFFPGFRIGYLSVPPQLEKILERCKSICDVHTSNLTQGVVLHYLESGRYIRDLDRIKRACKMRREKLCALLHEIGIDSFLVPRGGIYLWIATKNLSGSAFAAMARKAGVMLAPGGRFHWKGDDVNGVRLNYSSIKDDETAWRKLEWGFKKILLIK